MTDQIEMWWKCTSCGTLNGGLSKRCGERVICNGKVVKGSHSGCGKPLDHMNWIMPDDISTSANLTDTDQISQAKEGPDWKCKYCGGTQRNSKGDCCVCGGDRDNSTRRNEVINTVKSKDKKSKLSVPVLIGIFFFFFFFFCIALISALIWFFVPRHVNAKVKSVSWSSIVHVERFKKVNDDGWDVPTNAEDIISEGQRVHHYDHIMIGTHQERYTDHVYCGKECENVKVSRTCRSNSNGTARCKGGGTKKVCSPRYCNETRYRTVPSYIDQPIYRSWYSWRVWMWVFQRDVKIGGNDLKLYSPTVKQIALNIDCKNKEKERQSSPTFTYQCNFEDSNGKSFTFKPGTESDFKKCISGRTAKLKVVNEDVSVEKWQ